MTTRGRCVLLVSLLLCGADSAAAEVIRYVGPHPVAPDVHQGLCYIEGPHVHLYKPHKPLLYLEVNGGWVFIGDPVQFAPKAKKYTYYDHHPVFWSGAPVANPEHYCYISGPHYHLAPPPPRLQFKLKGGVHWYVGGHPQWYQARRARHRQLDEYYASVRLHRPRISVRPPTGFIGVEIGPGGGRVHGQVGGGVHVAPPSVQVNVPVPFVDIRLGGAGPAPRRAYRVHPAPRYKYKHKSRPPRHAPAWGARGQRGKPKYKIKYKAGRKGKGKGRHK